MAPLFERAVALLIAELRLGLPTEFVERDLIASGVPLHDHDALVSCTVVARSQALVAELIGERPERVRGRPPASILKQAVLFAAFQHHERAGLRRTHAMGAAAAAFGTTKDVVEKAVRAIESRRRAGDELVAAVVSLAMRILPVAIAEIEQDVASAERARHRARHIRFPPECPPFSARPVAR